MADLVRVGRINPIGLGKRGAVTTAPVDSGTFVPPTVFPRYIPPFDWNPERPPLESEAVDGYADLPAQVAGGPSTLNGKKINAYLQPNDAIGTFLMAGLGTDTVTGDGAADAYAHNFTRAQVAQLPTYDVWANGGTAPVGQQAGFAVMMANAVDLFFNKAELSRVETEWNGLYYVPGLALTPVITRGGARPLSFATLELDIAALGTQLDLQVAHFKIDNKVVADHVLMGDSTYPRHIWSEGMAVSFDLESILTNVQEYNKFLNHAQQQVVITQKLGVLVTAQEQFAVPAPESYKFYVVLPEAFYRTAMLTFPTGVVRTVFSGGAVRGDATLGAGGNSYAMVGQSIGIQYVNGDVTPY